MKLLILVIGGLYLYLLLLLYYKRIKTLSPAFVMQFVWIIYIVMGLLLSPSGQQINYFGIIWIVVALNFFSLGSMTSKRFVFKRSVNKAGLIWTINYVLCKRLLIILTLILYIITIYGMATKGINIRTFFDMNKLFDINANAAHTRYYGGGSTFSIIDRIVSQLQTLITYLVPFLSGVFIVIAKNMKDKILCYLPFIPTILELTLNNGKLGLIVTAFLFICGIFSANLMFFGKIPKLKFKNMFFTLILTSLFFGFLFIAMVLRSGSFDSYMMNILKVKFVNYAFGSIFAFNYWFTNLENIPYYFGARTINGISNILGILPREQGVYSEFFIDMIWNTNVYTAFRGIIEDFGKVGGLIFMYILGFFAGMAHSNVLSTKPTALSFSVLSASYFFTLYSFIISPWSYTSLILIFVLIAIILNVVKEKKSNDYHIN